jgi:hypothetical protein
MISSNARQKLAQPWYRIAVSMHGGQQRRGRRENQRDVDMAANQ